MGREPHMGPGLWISIKHRFGPRMSEWFAAFHTIAIGYVLLRPEPLFDQPAWVYFRQVFRDEDLLGMVLLMIGMLRLTGLIINGARKDVTPMIRQISAGISCMIWAGMTYCYAQSGIAGLWLAIFPLFAVKELVNIHRAAHDQGEARNGRTR